MPYLVNGELVTDALIREECDRIGRDPQWNNIPDATERANRLRAAAEQCATDHVLIEQAALNDPRPIDAIALEHETARQKREFGCRAAYYDNDLRRFTERSLRVTRIRREMVAEAPKPSPQDIEDFYNANGHNFRRPEMFHASHIVKYVSHEQSEERAEAAIEAALAELERGEPFADVANRHSDCKDKGGDLGRFPAGYMVEEFEEEIRALEPGQRSGIFTTPFGFHIAILHSKTPVGQASLDEVCGAIERVMTFAREHEAYQRAVAAMRAQADIRWVPPAEAAAS